MPDDGASRRLFPHEFRRSSDLGDATLAARLRSSAGWAVLLSLTGRTALPPSFSVV